MERSVWSGLGAKLFPGQSGEKRSGEENRHRGIAITLSILISCVLWFSFTMTEEYTVQVSFPTEVENLPPGTALRELPPKSVQVELRGEGFQVFRLKYNPPVIDLNAATSGEINVMNALPELPKNVSAPAAVPRTISLNIGERITRKVPVQLNAEIELADAYDFVQSPRIYPDSVEVSGARTVVNAIDYWPTERVELEDFRDSLQINVSLSDTLEGLVTPLRDFVTLAAEAEKFTTDRRQLDVVATGFASDKEEVRLEPSVLTVDYRVPLKDYFALQRVSSALFYAEVNKDSLRYSESGLVKPQIVYPPEFDIRDIHYSPEELRVYWRQN